MLRNGDAHPLSQNNLIGSSTAIGTVPTAMAIPSVRPVPATDHGEMP